MRDLRMKDLRLRDLTMTDLRMIFTYEREIREIYIRLRDFTYERFTCQTSILDLESS